MPLSKYSVTGMSRCCVEHNYDDLDIIYEHFKYFPDGYFIFIICIDKVHIYIFLLGEPGLFIAGIPEFYKDKFYKGPQEVNEKKVLRNVFKDGDSFFNFGDLMYMDKDYFIYFQDRVGDTFRYFVTSTNDNVWFNMKEEKL